MTTLRRRLPSHTSHTSLYRSLLVFLFATSASAFLMPAATRPAFVPTLGSSRRKSALPVTMFPTTEGTVLLLSMEESGGGIGAYLAPGILFLAAGAFVYANVVYTPEIIENTVEMKLEIREVQIRKLLSVVRQHQQDGLDLDAELRAPLEEAFRMTIEEYVSRVDQNKNSDEKSNFTTADGELADALRPISRVG